MVSALNNLEFAAAIPRVDPRPWRAGRVRATEPSDRFHAQGYSTPSSMIAPKRLLVHKSDISQPSKRETKANWRSQDRDGTSHKTFTNSSPFSVTKPLIERPKTLKSTTTPGSKQVKVVSPRIESLRQDSRKLELECSPSAETNHVPRQCSCFHRSKNDECSCPENRCHVVQNQSLENSYEMGHVKAGDVESTPPKHVSGTTKLDQIFSTKNPDLLKYDPTSIYDTGSTIYFGGLIYDLAPLRSPIDREEDKSMDWSTGYPASTSSTDESWPASSQQDCFGKPLACEEKGCNEKLEDFQAEFPRYPDSSFEEYPDTRFPKISIEHTQSKNDWNFRDSSKGYIGEVSWTSIQSRFVFSDSAGEFVEQKWSCAGIYDELMEITFIKRDIHFESILEITLTDDSVRDFYWDVLPDYFDLPLGLLKLVFNHFYADGKDRYAKENIQKQKNDWLQQLKAAFHVYRNRITSGISHELAIKDACLSAKTDGTRKDECSSTSHLASMMKNIRMRGGQGEERSSIDSMTSHATLASTLTSQDCQPIEEKRGRSPTPRETLKRKIGDDTLFVPEKKRVREKRVHFDKHSDGSDSSGPEPDFLNLMDGESAAVAQGSEFGKKKAPRHGTRGRAIRTNSYKPGAVCVAISFESGMLTKKDTETSNSEEGEVDHHSP